MATRIREKAQKRLEEKDNRPFAIVKHVRMSPSKIRIVLNLVRGKKALEACAILENSTTAASEPVLKVLKSAIANAENNKSLSKDDLFVAECYACPGPVLKQINIRARGRADRLLKRTSHITVILDQNK